MGKEDNQSIELGKDGREQIYRYLSRWKTGLELNSNTPFTDANLRDYINELKKAPDKKLKDMWFHNVSEWLCSKNDLNIPDGNNLKNWVENQFTVLIAGGNTKYGFVTDIHIGHQ